MRREELRPSLPFREGTSLPAPERAPGGPVVTRLRGWRHGQDARWRRCDRGRTGARARRAGGGQAALRPAAVRGGLWSQAPPL